MQLVGNYHENVLGCLDVMQDDDYLYTVMPYCEGGDLYARIMPSPRRTGSSNASVGSRSPHSVNEAQARNWFKQLLSVSTSTVMISLVDIS